MKPFSQSICIVRNNMNSDGSFQTMHAITSLVLNSQKVISSVAAVGGKYILIIN